MHAASLDCECKFPHTVDSKVPHITVLQALITNLSDCTVRYWSYRLDMRAIQALPGQQVAVLLQLLMHVSQPPAQLPQR